MLICSHLFLCEHLVTFQFCALMLKISEENFAGSCSYDRLGGVGGMEWAIVSLGSGGGGVLPGYPYCSLVNSSSFC